MISVAPVSASDTDIDPERIAADVLDCYEAGAAMVHLHVRDRKGKLTTDMGLLEETLRRIRKDSDMILQVSTGGVSDMTIEERCTPLYLDLVEACSLNVGSTNLGKAVYCNPIEDVEYCIREILKQKKFPEVETFEIGHTWTMEKLMEQYPLPRPVLLNIVLGHEGEAPATPKALAAMISMIPKDAEWGITQAGRKDFSLLAGALGLGARTVRIGFEDSRFLDPETVARTNMPLVEKTAQLIRSMDKDVMTPSEARAYFGIGNQGGKS